MNDWLDNLLDSISLEKVGCGIVIAAGIFGIWWFIFESSFIFKAIIGVLVAALVYLVYESSKNSDGGDSAEDDF